MEIDYYSFTQGLTTLLWYFINNFVLFLQFHNYYMKPWYDLLFVILLTNL